MKPITQHEITANESLYTEIIEPLGHRAKEKNDRFLNEYSKVINKFTMAFMQAFCDSEGQRRRSSNSIHRTMHKKKKKRPFYMDLILL